eukprot:1618440-Amphidinium_carterae.1
MEAHGGGRAPGLSYMVGFISLVEDIVSSGWGRSDRAHCQFDNYGEKIRDFANLYGPRCWWLVYQADMLMRSD